MRARPEEMACVRDACRRVIHHTAASVSKQENHGAFLHTAEAGGSLRNIIVVFSKIQTSHSDMLY